MMMSLAACLVVSAGSGQSRAATISAGNVTTTLGPAFFVDDAANGGTDTDINQPTVASYNRYFSGLLNRNQGPTRITLTGFGFAAHTSAAANSATSLAVTFTYLGADEVLGGGDDSHYFNDVWQSKNQGVALHAVRHVCVLACVRVRACCKCVCAC